jgi:hypothetical protein
MPKIRNIENPKILPFALKGSNKRFEKKKKSKSRMKEYITYTPDLTSIAFDIRQKVRRKDLKNFIKNPPELRTLLEITK